MLSLILKKSIKLTVHIMREIVIKTVEFNNQKKCIIIIPYIVNCINFIYILNIHKKRMRTTIFKFSS
jgi:hypothetical protein